MEKATSRRLRGKINERRIGSTAAKKNKIMDKIKFDGTADCSRFHKNLEVMVSDTTDAFCMRINI